MSEIALSISQNFMNKANIAPQKNGSNLWAYAAFDDVCWTPDRIIQHVTHGYAICIAETANNHRKGEYFKSAQIMGVDFDNGPDVTGLMLNPLVREYAFLVYATPSSTPEAPRSRALFALDTPISDSAEYKRLVKRLLMAFQVENADEQCKDVVRIFYGSAGQRFSDVPDAVLPIAILLGLPEHPDEQKPTYTAPAIAPIPNGDRTPYVQRAVENELAELSSTRAHRNGALNETAFALGQLVGATWTSLSYFEVEQACYSAALANGYVQKDGEHAARSTIKSGLNAGMAQPRPEPPNWTLIVRASASPTQAASGVALAQPASVPAAQAVVWRTSVDSMQRYRERLSTPRLDGKLPLVFPFKALHEFGGFCRVVAPGVMIGVVGMSGGLKTSFAETITENWRQMDANDVLWWGPEWSWERMADRAVQRRGGANMTDVMLHELYLQETARGVKVRDGVKLKDGVYQTSIEKAVEIGQWPGMNHYIEQMDIDIDDLLLVSAQRLLDAKEMGRTIRVAVWDYLQLLDMRSARSEPERITTILGRLKAFCVENDLIGIVPTQVTKTASADTKENQKLLTSEAGQFFRGDKFNLVLTLNPIYEGKVLTDEGYINVDKNSIGRTGAVKVLVDPAHLMWVDSIAPL